MQTMFITGANRGLGLGHVDYGLSHGYRVIATARDPGHVPAFAERQKMHGERFVPVTLDVGSEPSIEELRHRLSGTTLDLAINNAAICPDENLGNWSADAFADTLRVNVTGAALVAQAALPYMPEGAKLINVSSGMGSLELNINPGNGADAYAVSKAALNILTRRLAEKLRPRGIIVAAMNPGWVRTDMGGEGAPGTVEQAVAHMHGSIEALTLGDSGCFVSETGEAIPW